MRVLFIGNSHTFFNDMPQTFKLLAESAGVPTEVAMIAHGGKPLSWHLKEAVEIRFALLYGRYDYVIVQQAAHTPPVPPSPEETLKDVLTIQEMARTVGAEVIPTVIWAERHAPEHQSEMNRGYNLIMENSDMRCSPAGQVFMAVKNEHPEIDMYFEDGAHCSPYGSYAVACCVFSQVFERSPEGLPNRGHKTSFDMSDAAAELDAEKCAVIQRLAWRYTQEINETRSLPV
ncbi:MAG: hypothetical protein PUB32_08255 [Clostridiales bacterium]|nr:hypothetical protein [Clostridiales bacterium]